MSLLTYQWPSGTGPWLEWGEGGGGGAARAEGREEGRVPRAALLRENRANGQQGRVGKVFFSRKEIVGKLGTVCVRSHKYSAETPPDVPRQLGVRSHTPSEKDKKGQLWEQLWEPQPPPLHRQVRNSARACGGGGRSE